MKSTPVKGTKDFLPREVQIRDYLQNIILETYQDSGFMRIATPIIDNTALFFSQACLNTDSASNTNGLSEASLV